MKRRATTQIAGVIALTVLGTTALASNPEALPEEKRGAVIGGIIGAGVGGPIGAGAGAMIGGGLIGKAIGVHRQNGELAARLADVEAQHKADERATRKLEARVRRLTAALEAARTAGAVAKASPSLPIQFRTASSEVEPHYEAELASVASAIAARPDVKVRLAGFADRRGDEDYNMALSQSRVEAVRAFLLQHGVSNSQIQTEAHGETKPVAADATPENHFFDRRVVLQVSVDEDLPVAAR